MTPYREEGSLTLLLDLSAEFGDDYEGDDDGYAWLARFREQVQPKLVKALFAALREDEAWHAIPRSRGRNPEEFLEISVQFRPTRSQT